MVEMNWEASRASSRSLWTSASEDTWRFSSNFFRTSAADSLSMRVSPANDFRVAFRTWRYALNASVALPVAITSFYSQLPQDGIKRRAVYNFDPFKRNYGVWPIVIAQSHWNSTVKMGGPIAPVTDPRWNHCGGLTTLHPRSTKISLREFFIMWTFHHVPSS